MFRRTITHPIFRAVLLILLAGSAAADETPPAETGFRLLPPPWAGNASVGYVQTGGNTSTSALNLKANLDYQGVDWGNSLLATAFNGSRDKTTTDERYGIVDKVNYNLSPRHYAFVDASYDNDRFAGISERYALTLGYGRHVFASARQTLDLEAGLGANESRERGQRVLVAHGIATLGGKYVLRLTPSSQFTQTLRTEYASNNIFVNPVSELKLNVIGNAYAALSFEIRYNSDVPSGVRNVDHISTINLGYGFGTP